MVTYRKCVTLQSQIALPLAHSASRMSAGMANPKVCMDQAGAINEEHGSGPRKTTVWVEARRTNLTLVIARATGGRQACYNVTQIPDSSA